MRFELRCVCRDHHAVFDRCRTRRNESTLVSKLHETRAALASRCQTVVMAERGNLDLEPSERAEDGRTGRTFTRPSVDDDVQPYTHQPRRPVRTTRSWTLVETTGSTM
jgi:hypothetical protein